METNYNVQHLLEKLHQAKHEIESKNQELARVKNQLQQSRHTADTATRYLLETQQELQNSKLKIMDLKQKHRRYLKWLFNRNMRRVCNNDCVSCVVAKIYEDNEEDMHGKTLCCAQLRTIISVHAGLMLEPKHINCTEFMDILKKCSLVKNCGEYKCSSILFSWQSSVKEAFNKLMTMDEDQLVVIIARVISETSKTGHTELCYLTARDQRKKVLTIDDPQSTTSQNYGQKEFMDHLRNDEGLILYTVDVKKLKEIINKHKPHLHQNTTDLTLVTGTSTGVIDEDP